MTNENLFIICITVVLLSIFAFLFSETVIGKIYDLKMAEAGMSQVVSGDKVLWVKCNEK
jgi:hypothetical protein